jgi:carbon monoxide dehydrogenase subunit G
MLTLTGDKPLPVGRADAFPKLADLRFLVECLPDLHAVKSASESAAEATLRPGFSFARGEMHLTAERGEVTPPTSATFRLATKGIGTSSQVEATFQLGENEGGSLLTWTVEVKQLGGLLKAVPSGLIRGGAERVIGDLLTRVEQRLTDGGRGRESEVT